MDYYVRAVDRYAKELLDEFPAILVVGPRACGKTTSMVRLSDSEINLDVPEVAESVRDDPDDLLTRFSGTLLIEEWQEVPEILRSR